MDPHAQALIDFISHHLVKIPGLRIGEDMPLISSGLVDSFSLVDLVLKLEEVTGKRIRVGDVSPADFETVRMMLAVAARS